MIKLNQKLRQVEIIGLNVNNKLVCDYFNNVAHEDYENQMLKAIYIGVSAMNKEGLTAILSKTGNELDMTIENQYEVDDDRPNSMLYSDFDTYDKIFKSSQYMVSISQKINKLQKSIYDVGSKAELDRLILKSCPAFAEFWNKCLLIIYTNQDNNLTFKNNGQHVSPSTIARRAREGSKSCQDILSFFNDKFGIGKTQISQRLQVAKYYELLTDKPNFTEAYLKSKELVLINKRDNRNPKY